MFCWSFHCVIKKYDSTSYVGMRQIQNDILYMRYKNSSKIATAEQYKALKGRGTWKKLFLLVLFEPWVEYSSQDFLEIFCLTSFCRNRSVSYAKRMRSSFIWLWWNEGAVTAWCQKRDVEHVPQVLIKAGKSIMSDGSSDSSNLCLSCSVSSVKNEESELSEVEHDLKWSNHISLSL